MKFSKMIVLILLLFVSSLLFCKSDSKKQKELISDDISSYKKYIGVSVSSVSSYGISYSVRMDQKTDLKLVSFFYYNKDKGSDAGSVNKIINIGAEYHHILHMTKLSKLFIFVAGGYGYSSMEYEEKSIASVGAGLGVDFLVMDNFFWELGLGYNFRQGRNANTFTPGIIIGASYAF